MSRVEPGEIEALLPAAPPRQAEGLGGHRGRPRAHRAARHHALEPPGLVRLLPLQHRSLVGARRPRRSRPRAPVHELADEPGGTEVELVVMDWLRQMLGLPEPSAA